MGSAKESRFERLTAWFISQKKVGQSKHRRLREHVTKRRLVLLIPIILIVSAIAAQNLYETYGPGACQSISSGFGAKAEANKVGLVDTLAYEYPDTTFVRVMESAARSAGMGFDYFTPNTISLDTFVHLPARGYSILILRTHMAYSNTTATALQVAITTSEPYDNYRWVPDQETDRLTDVNLNGSHYFGLTPLFVTERMCGQFPHTLVLAMGCYGMNSNDISGAFLQKGAGAFIGWKGLVRVDQTDLAFETLVPLLLNGTRVADAVQLATPPIVSPDDPVLSYTTG